MEVQKSSIFLKMKVAISLASKYDIVILEGPTETDIAKDIENELIKNNFKLSKFIWS